VSKKENHEGKTKKKCRLYLKGVRSIEMMILVLVGYAMMVVGMTMNRVVEVGGRVPRRGPILRFVAESGRRG